MAKVVSSHQPNFIPRMNFFEKIAQSDLFVIMSNCKYSSSAYQNRFNIGDTFYNMVVESGTDLIYNKKYKNPERDWKNITDEFPVLRMFDSMIHQSLRDTNTAIIKSVCGILNIQTRIVHDYPTHKTGTERLVDICEYYGATHYLSGISGLKYLDLKLFDRAGIEVIFQDEKTMDKRPLVEVL